MTRRILYMVLVLFLFKQDSYAQLWKQYRDSADILRQQKDIDGAIKYYNLSKEFITGDAAFTDPHIEILTNIATLYYTGKSQYLEAEPFYLQARELIAKKYGIENEQYAANANSLGQVNYFLKHYYKSEAFYLEAKQVWEKLNGKKSKQYAGICNALGILYNDNGQFEKAEAQHLEAKATREELKDNGAYAQSCNNLAALYWNLGLYDKAEPLAIEAKEIRGRVEGIPKSAYAISCINLANIYRDMGKYQQAEKIYIEAKDARADFFKKDHGDYALSCDILANLYYFMKQYEKAKPLYLEAKSIREKIFFSKGYFYAQSCSNLAALYREMGHLKEAESLALEAGAIWEGIGPAVDADITINDNSLGTLYFIMGRYDKAELYFLKARDKWKISLGEAHPFYIKNSLSLAKVYWANNEVEKANDLYVKAFDAQNIQSHRLFSFTSEEEKQLYLKNITGTEDEYQSFYFEKFNHGNKGKPYEISLQKRNQVLASSKQFRQLIYTSGDSALSEKYDTWISLKKQISALYSKGEAALKEHLRLITEKADLLEKDLVRSSNTFKKTYQHRISWEAIQQQLKPSEAAIEFIEFNYFNGSRTTDSTFYAALLLRKDMAEPEWVTLFEKKKLDSLLAKASDGGQSINTFYTRGIRFKNKGAGISVLVYNTVWKPLESKLNGITTIYFAPAGLLHRIAFAALPVDSSKVLSDKYRLVQVSTTADVADQVPDYAAANDKIYLFGGIQYNTDPAKIKSFSRSRSLAKRNGFNYLPGTAKEVNKIAQSGRLKNFSPIVLQGLAARENIVKAMNGKLSPEILHVASHGFFFNDPQQLKPGTQLNEPDGGKVFQRSGDPLFRSGLLFAGANDAWNAKYMEGAEDDGILTAFEVSNLYLPKTKLVVLSACETALGDIKGSEGVYGLQRAFKMAGVKNLVMSLWKVPDNETAEFMQLFYKNMFDGKTIDQSFYEAQIIMKNNYRKEPFKWAAWILLK